MNQVKSTDVKSTKSVQLSKSPRNKKSKKKQTVDSVAQEQKQIRDHLTREEKFNSASHHRGWSDWEAWCEKVTLAELKDELRAASQSVSRLMDKSNHAVETIAEHRRYAGEQYLRNFQCHSELIDYVHDLYKVFQDSAHQMYDSERDRLVSEFFNEAAGLDQLANRRKVYYENVAHAVSSLAKCANKNLKEDFIEGRVEVESASIVRREDDAERAAKRQAIVCFEVKKLSNLFDSRWPKKRLDQFQKALTKNEESGEAVRECGKRIEESNQSIKKLEEELRSFNREKLSKTAGLKAELLFMRRIAYKIEEKKKREGSMDDHMMKHLAVAGDAMKKKLNKTLERGAAIRTAQKICSKFEKLRDKTESFEESQTQEFLKKLANVEADCVMLRSYKADLTKENENLKAQIEAKTHELGLQQNLEMLRLYSTPTVGQISQISHKISQIKAPIELRKRWKLCKHCEANF